MGWTAAYVYGNAIFSTKIRYTKFFETTAFVNISSILMLLEIK